MTGPRGAIFLDRDGVLNVNLDGHVRSWEEFELLPGALDAVRTLHRAGWPIVVVTNQSAIGRGLTTEAAVADIHARLSVAAEAAGGRIARVVHCPHHPDQACECRKPRPGMLLAAAADLGIAIEASFFVGDHVTDVEAALAAGARPILVRTGRGAAAAEEVGRRFPTVPIVDDLPAAAGLLLAARP